MWWRRMNSRSLVVLLERRIDVAVSHDVAGAAGGHLVDVHVEAPLLVPGQQPVVVVHLATLRLVVVRHVAAAASGLPDYKILFNKYYSIMIIIPFRTRMS